MVARVLAPQPATHSDETEHRGGSRYLYLLQRRLSHIDVVDGFTNLHMAREYRFDTASIRSLHRLRYYDITVLTERRVSAS